MGDRLDQSALGSGGASECVGSGLGERSEGPRGKSCESERSNPVRFGPLRVRKEASRLQHNSTRFGGPWECGVRGVCSDRFGDSACSLPCSSLQGSYLVDPASSHMLVSKIKPCMSKYKLLYTVKLRMAH